MTTIADIARKMQLSTATVSRALNRSRLVDESLTEKIRRQADAMGYRKRSIRRHRGRSILNIKLVLPHHVETERSLFYDFSSLITGIKSGFTSCEINLVCETVADHFEPYPHKKGGDINGFIFAFHQPCEQALEKIQGNKTPYVVINRSIEHVPCVASENREGMRRLIEHLYEKRGDELKPAFISLGWLDQIHDERLEGMSAACKKLGITFSRSNDCHRYASMDEVSAQKVAQLASNYNALVCVNDIMGMVILAELDRLCVSVPGNLSVTGFDNSPLRNLSRPLLTTVSMPIHELARVAAQGLENEIVNHVAQCQLHRVSGALIVGESS